MEGGGEGTRGLQTYLEPGTKPKSYSLGGGEERDNGGGVGRGHEGYRHTSSPGLNQNLNHQKDRLLKTSRPFFAQI